jgi:predicted translin family RNA/ssDNA-binding protein
MVLRLNNKYESVNSNTDSIKEILKIQLKRKINCMRELINRIEESSNSSGISSITNYSIKSMIDRANSLESILRAYKNFGEKTYLTRASDELNGVLKLFNIIKRDIDFESKKVR